MLRWRVRVNSQAGTSCTKIGEIGNVAPAFADADDKGP
jgi:hypothetical protein